MPSAAPNVPGYPSAGNNLLVAAVEASKCLEEEQRTGSYLAVAGREREMAQLRRIVVAARTEEALNDGGRAFGRGNVSGVPRANVFDRGNDAVFGDVLLVAE